MLRFSSSRFAYGSVRTRTHARTRQTNTRHVQSRAMYYITYIKLFFWSNCILRSMQILLIKKMLQLAQIQACCRSSLMLLISIVMNQIVFNTDQIFLKNRERVEKKPSVLAVPNTCNTRLSEPLYIYKHCLQTAGTRHWQRCNL